VIEIVPVRDRAIIEAIREIFQEYEDSLGFRLDFQNFQEELEALPGEYAPPAGELFVARVDGALAGCVALRPLSGPVCELKRLYVRPEFRGRGLGRKLCEIVLEQARRIGYQAIRLDTVESMNQARRLYCSLGFKPIPSYRLNPLAGAEYFELDLSRG